MNRGSHDQVAHLTRPMGMIAQFSARAPRYIQEYIEIMTSGLGARDGLAGKCLPRY